MRWVLLAAAVALCAVGCSNSVTVKPDPWQEYETALNVVEYESKFKEQVFDLVQRDPSDANKELYEKASARFDAASKHASEVRARLPK